MKKGGLFLIVLTVFLITTIGSALAFDSPLKVGWVIGDDDKNNAYILHTKNEGKKWMVQGKWAGHKGMDISAVDKQTAWAALGPIEGDGMILHTTNGGVTWTEQTLPEGVDGEIKGIKGLTRHEAWAVSLHGTILHTTDGGENWSIVDPGEDIDIESVNRMDAIGFRDVRDEDRSGKNTGKIYANVWIADERGDSGDYWGMIHTLYNGELWRQEEIISEISSGVHMVSAYSPRVVWAYVQSDGNLYRTEDGGETWNSIPGIDFGPKHIDDMCSPSSDTVWAVQRTDMSSGMIYRVRVPEAGEPKVLSFDLKLGYAYGGVTCVDDQTALVVGYSEDPSMFPKGVIVSTTDGGDNWISHPIPVDDVQFWKVSFVGARR